MPEMPLSQEDDRLLRHLCREEQAAVAGVDYHVVGQAGQPGFIDGDGAVVLAVEAGKQRAETMRHATGELEGVEYEEIRYEGYAPGGVAVIVDCLTDNKVRTVADVRHAFGKFGGNLGTDGSVAFLFRKLGVLSYAAGADEEKITDAAIEAGAEDVVVYPEDGSIDVLASPDSFAEVKAALEAAGLAPDAAEITMRADNDIAVEGDTAKAVAKLLDWLDDLDDVQDVYSNAAFGEDAYA